MIEFHYEDVDFRLDNPDRVAEWVRGVAAEHGRCIEALNYIFCSDEYLWRLNVQYLGHEDYTDVLTFDLTEPDAGITADVFVSVERVAENAREFNVAFYDELCRVMIHGLLHILGFDDGDEFLRRRMRTTEDRMLALRDALAQKDK